MIKAIFLDIDGTLISGKRPSIKKEVIEGLKQVRKKRNSIVYSQWKTYVRARRIKTC